MDLKHALRAGMRVVGPDDRDYGAIERFDDQAVYVQGRAIPFAAIDRLDQDRLYLGAAGPEQAAGSDAADARLGGEIRVPVLEERLEVGPRVVDLGEIRVHKTVEEREEVRRGPLSREDVQIERIRVDRPVAAPEERHQEGDWLVIPIMEEIFVVQKQLIVREEIRIRKQLVMEEAEVRETVRREHASIEDTRPASARAPSPAASGRTDDAAWEHLHEEIHDADR